MARERERASKAGSASTAPPSAAAAAIDAIGRCSVTSSRPAAAAAGTEEATLMSELVEQVGTFPIGLLANAQLISSLVEGFDPSAYAARYGESAAKEAKGHRARVGHTAAAAAFPCTVHAARSRATVARPAGSAQPSLERVAVPQLKLPDVHGDDRGVALPAIEGAASTARGMERAASAPLPIKSTRHSRWLQRGLTRKDNLHALPLPPPQQSVQATRPESAVANEGASKPKRLPRI